jgi:hypothetical protein
MTNVRILCFGYVVNSDLFLKLFYCLDEVANVGDVVLIKQSRPHSKRKTFELAEIVKSANH